MSGTLLANRYRGRRLRIVGKSFGQIKTVNALNGRLRSGACPLESVPCCICNRTRFEPLSETDRHGVLTSVVICSGCGLVQSNPRPTAAGYAEYYARDYQQLEYGQDQPADQFFASQYARGQEIFAYLEVNQALPRAGGRVLEVGCSSGGILQRFKEAGYVVRGVDLSRSFTDFGRTRHGLDLSVGTIGDVARDWSPDLVIYSHTLEHVLDPNLELQQIRERLGDGGQLYIQVPGIKDLRATYWMDFLAYIQFAHTYHFSLASLTNLLDKNGFRLLAGDEGVNAICAKSAAPANAAPKNDYASVMEYLRKAEREQPLLRVARIPVLLFRMAMLRLKRRA